MKQQNLSVALAAALALTFAGTASAEAPDANRVLVTFKAGARANVHGALRDAGGRVHLELAKQRAFAVSLSPKALERLRKNPNIELIEPDAVRYPLGQVTPYGITNVQAPEAVALGADGTGIKVCVIDSVLKADHEDFAGIEMSGDASPGQTWTEDTCGHGTHVTGTIAAVNNDIGVVGVSPGKVSLHLVKVFDGPDCGWSYASTLIDAANKCAAAGAKIISMSLGGGGRTTAEENGFNNLFSQGILSIAAAGNDGNDTLSYPASYDSVMSVAAIDQNNVKADFSQFNAQVEIAAPGVGTLSTYPLRDAAVTVASVGYMATAIAGSIQGSTANASVDGGRCTSAGSWTGKVVLCERGDINFLDKVNNATAGGASGVVIYNNVPGGFSGTLGDGNSSTIPAVGISQEDGQFLKANQLGSTTFVSTLSETDVNAYAFLDGTSMATPHVSGVAALVWSAKPDATNQQVRDALDASALDLGAPGRDVEYGFGLVQAFDAIDALLNGTTPPPPVVVAPSELTATAGAVVRRKNTFNLAWTGGKATVDIYRGATAIIRATSNTGTYTDAVKVRGSGSFTYKVCNAGTTECSNPATVSF